MIIHNKAKKASYPEHKGPLTIKCPLKGKETFVTPERKFIVDNDNYLILNDGQTYSCSIDSKEDVEIISVFFRPQFAEEVLGSLINSSDKLLEMDDIETDQPVFFLEKLYKQDRYITPYIMKFRLASENNFDDEQWIEEEFYLLLENMLKVHRNIGKTIEKLPSVKKSTKIEIYRRLDIAKEYIRCQYRQRYKNRRYGKGSLSFHLPLYSFIQSYIRNHSAQVPVKDEAR